jgi:SAM-dependent methyltransferase
MRARRFTGERLHEGASLFAVDMARHQAAYELALHHGRDTRVLDLGCGSGYGSAQLARGGAQVVAVDRVVPDAAHRGAASFVLADLNAMPLRARSFDLVVSFQVVEHLEDPTAYLAAIARLVRPEGLAILTTPNLLTSDGVNPYHVHEYTSEELAALLARYFDDVEMQGVGMSTPVRDYMEARSARIQRIMRLDPLKLRDRLPKPLIEKLFAFFALVVRRRTQGGDGTPDASWQDFPIGPPSPSDIDLVALCRNPRNRSDTLADALPGQNPHSTGDT